MHYLTPVVAGEGAVVVNEQGTPTSIHKLIDASAAMTVFILPPLHVQQDMFETRRERFPHNDACPELEQTRSQVMWSARPLPPPR